MGCKHSDINGLCQMFDEDDVEGRPEGCEDDGFCLVEDDPSPEDSCESYESEDE